MGEYRTYTGEVMRQEKFFPAWELPQDDAYVQVARAGLEAAGLHPQVSAYRFCTNAAYSAGVAGVPTVGFGPATEADAHMIDERLRIDDLLAARAAMQASSRRCWRSANLSPRSDAGTWT